MFIRNCPTCGEEITHKSKRSLYESIRINRSCKKCGNKNGGIKRIGMKHTDEMKKKLSESKMGIKFTEKHKKKLSEAKIGIKLSDNHKINIGNSIKGIKRSDETKLKCSLSKIGAKNPTKRTEVREKIRKSVNKMYLDKPEIKEKISISLIKYFNDNPNYTNLEELSRYQIYRKQVKNLTNRLRKELFNNWDGIDYYDDEIIKYNLNLHYNDENYPTIDHKTSILEGYKLGINPEILSDTNNLCITKRKLNTSKGYMDEDKFLKKLGK